MSKNPADRVINISISTRTIFVTLLILLGSFVIYLVQDVIIILFLALVLALALEPLVNWLKSKGLSHGFSVMSSVFVLILAAVGLFSIAIVPFVQQLQQLMVTFPTYANSLTSTIPTYDIYSENFDTSQALNQLSKSTGGLINATLNFFSGLLNGVIVVSFVIYLLLDFRNLRRRILSLFPTGRRKELKGLFTTIETKLGDWLRGQVVLMFIVGFLTYVGLTLLGFEYALALAVLAGLFEIVPIVGPLIAAIPAVIIGFLISPLTGLGVIGLSALIQQFENQYIVPKIMQKAVGFNPLVTIIALLVGVQLFGIIGAILAVPFTIILFEITKYVLSINQEEEEDGKEK